MFTELISTAASLGGALLGYHGQMQTNASNEAIANNATAFNADEAKKNRDFQAQQAQQSMDFSREEATRQMAFQERMSSTAKGRAIEDLKRSGLNPILAANDGASTPAGAAGSGAAGSGAQARAETATMQNPYTSVVGATSSALEALTMVAGLKRMEAETNLINANTKKSTVDTEVAKKSIPKAELTNDAYDVIRPFVKKIKEWFTGGSGKKQQGPIKLNNP